MNKNSKISWRDYRMTVKIAFPSQATVSSTDGRFKKCCTMSNNNNRPENSCSKCNKKLYMMRTALCNIADVRDVYVSRHNVGPIQGPLKVIGNILPWGLRGFKQPHDAELLHLCKYSRRIWRLRYILHKIPVMYNIEIYLPCFLWLIILLIWPSMKKKTLTQM